MSATVIPLHTTKQAKANGVFAAINIAARRMGRTNDDALRAAIAAKRAYLAGGRSPARVVADERAALRQAAEQVLA